jgi:hypothetical protein
LNFTDLSVISATVLWMSLTCLPAEDSEREGSEVVDAHDANHSSVGIHDDSEGVVADEAQAEGLVEAAGAGSIFGGDEGYKGAVGKHA